MPSSSYVVDVGAAATHALETGDNVVTAATVGAAVVGGAAMQVAPQSVRDKLPMVEIGAIVAFIPSKTNTNVLFTLPVCATLCSTCRCISLTCTRTLCYLKMQKMFRGTKHINTENMQQRRNEEKPAPKKNTN